MKINRYLWYFLYIIPGPFLGIAFFVGCFVLIIRWAPGACQAVDGRWAFDICQMVGKSPAKEMLVIVLIMVGALGSIALVRNVLFRHLFVPACPKCEGLVKLTHPRSISFKCTECRWNNES